MRLKILLLSLTLLGGAMLRAPAQTDNPLKTAGLAEQLPTRADMILAQAQAAQPLSPEEAATNALGQLPQSGSFSNTVIEIDVGYVALGIGQTGTAEGYVRGIYDFTQTLAVGAEFDLGAANVVNDEYGVFEVHKNLSNWAQIYAVAALGYSQMLEELEGFVGAGTRIAPISALPQAAVVAEADANIHAGGQESGAIRTALSYHF